MAETQEKRILAFLKSGRPLTPLQALKKFGCFRLGARVYDLRQQGHAINKQTIKENNKYFAQYRWVGQICEESRTKQ